MKSYTLNITKKATVSFINFPKLTACGAVRHVFSTREGGVSTGRYSTMNLSFNNGDLRENVLENYERLCACAGIEISHLVLSRQTHTDNVQVVTEQDIGRGIFKPGYSDVDGLVTDVPGIALVTQYADCTPLLFCDPVRRVAATSHAGWRGTVKEIGRVTVEKMQSLYGCRPQDIIAAMGPCIGSCCYEVDDPVYDGLCKINYINRDRVFKNKGGGKYMLDLAEANRQVLVAAGIKPENLDVSDICTCCNSDMLHSHRATKGERGNLAAIIELI